jgi:hypothetical protein
MSDHSDRWEAEYARVRAEGGTNEQAQTSATAIDAGQPPTWPLDDTHPFVVHGVRLTMEDALCVERDMQLYGNAFVRKQDDGTGVRIPPAEMILGQRTVSVNAVYQDGYSAGVRSWAPFAWVTVGLAALCAVLGVFVLVGFGVLP